MRGRTSCSSSPSRARRPPTCASGSPRACSAATRSFPVTTFHAFCLAVLMRDAADAAPAGAARRAARAHARRRSPRSRTSASRRRARFSRRRCGSPSSATTTSRVPEHDLARVRERYVDALAERGALDYGGLQREAVALLERDEETRADVPERLPLRPRRRVPGHERRPGAAARAARRRAPQRLLRRRRGSVDLRLPRRRDRERARLRGALAGRAPLRPADQLPLGAARSSSSRRA